MKRTIIFLRSNFGKGIMIIAFILFLYFLAMMAGFLYVLTNY